MPDMVRVFFSVNNSLAGDEIDNIEEVEVGGAEVGVIDISEIGVGEGWATWACFRLLFAVQIPKVMISPSPNPIAIANTTSFFIIGLEINSGNW